MQLQGVKHLPKINHFTEEAYDQLVKKQQEYRKYTRGTYDRFEQIIKSNESFCHAFEKCFPSCLAEEGEVKLFHLGYFSGLSQTLQRMLVHHKQFGKRIINIYQQGSSDFAAGQAKEGELLNQLQRKVKSYRSSELNLIQSHKRFYKLYKTLLASTDLYKQAFTDVRLIYNKGQKIRRYTNCEQVYREIMNDYHLISELTSQMTQEKKQMKDIFQSFILASRNNVKTVGYKIKAMSVSYVQACFDMESHIMATFNKSIDTIAPIALEFNLLTPYLLNEQSKYLDEHPEVQVHPFIPSVILNYKHIKETHYPHISIFLTHLQKELVQVSKKRKNCNRQIYEMIFHFQRAYQRYYSSLKEFLIKYEKRKKKSQEFYGDNAYIFMNTFTKVLEICLEASDKVSKQITLKAKLIEQSLLEESKILDGLFKEYKLIIERLFNKKDTKRISFQKNQSESKREEIMKAETERLKAETISKLQHLKVLFQQTYEKIKKNSLQMKLHYNSILQLMEKTSIEKFAGIKEEIELGSQFALRKDDSEQLNQAIAAKTHLYEESAFGALLGDENKICFEADLNKIQEFTKLKKPVELENRNEKEMEQDLIGVQKQKQEQRKHPDEQMTVENESLAKNQCQSALNEGGGGEKVENASKNEAFLMTKITFGPQQKYCKSYVCGLADKIILSGRLFITNQRLCFFSKFNTKNVFFRETFLDIPKKDIRKIEKRSNAVIFDNSISITTVNGEIFFTSFFSRNEAFDMICSAMEISLDEFMYAEEKIQEPVLQETITKQQDDIKDSQILQREEKLKEIIEQSQKMDYRPILHTQFSGDGLNALKFLKTFELNNQITYQRGKYRGFSQFFKQLLGHTENDIEEWTPNLQDYLNSGNIKQGAPLTFTKKFNSMVPVANSGIPFMPKVSKIVQSFTLHLISKDKYVVFTTCKSHGVPYCDDFLIHYRKEVQTVGEDRVSYKMDFYNHFYTNTMMKGIILSKSFEESKTSLKKLEEEMKKYLKHLQKSKLSQSRVENGNQNQGAAALNALQQENDQLSAQLQQLKKEKQVLGKQIEVQRSKTSKARTLFLSSVILNILLFLYLIFGSGGREQHPNDIN